MIYRCENCKNRDDCPENKKQYERTCNTIGDIARAIDELPNYHCFYSLTIRCDYWCEDKETYIGTMESVVTEKEATKERTCRNCKNLKEINGGCKHCVTSTDPFTGKLNPPSHWQPKESEGK